MHIIDFYLFKSIFFLIFKSGQVIMKIKLYLMFD